MIKFGQYGVDISLRVYRKDSSTTLGFQRMLRAVGTVRVCSDIRGDGGVVVRGEYLPLRFLEVLSVPQGKTRKNSMKDFV